MEWIWPRTQKFNGKDISNWIQIDDIEKVTSLVTNVLMKHFHQSSDTPFANVYWKTKLSDPAFQQTILDGTYIYDDSLPSEANELLQSFSKKTNVKDIPLLPSWQDFTKFIQNATEKTSSSPSGRHYGHYKSLLHSAPSILKGIYKVMCLSLQHGIVLDRWKNTVTTLICKDNHTPYIHRLRPLHIVEAELQFFSKYQWSHRLINQAERLQNISQSQFGGRKYKQAQSSVINSIVTFDLHRQLRLPFSFNDDDLRANYDRELAHFSAIETRCQGLSHQAGKLLIDITSQQKFYIKTKNGVSSSHYSFSSDYPVWGLGQGISWAGSCWQFTATSIEQCLSKICQGATLSNPMRTKTIHQFMKFFIDDTTKICNTVAPDRSLLEQTTHNMQKHFNFVTSTGGTLALDKCRFFYILFGFDNNHDSYILSTEDSPGELIIKDNITGTFHTIKRVDANDARKSLGCYISPSHNQGPQFQALKDEIILWRNSMTFSSLSPQLILQSYETILKPKLVYRLSTTSLTFKKCEELVKLIRPIILNSHHTHRHFPKTILEASSMYAGLNFTHFYDLQGYEKLKFFTYHMRLQDSTGDLLLLSLQHTQVMLGVRQLFLNLPYSLYSNLVEITWITHLWHYLSDRELQVNITLPYAIPPQRSNDEYIMDVLIPLFTPSEIVKINKIRLHYNLLFLSDLADIRGRHILPDIKRGINHRKSHILFPHQTYSPKWLPLWKKACDKLDNYLSNHPLGEWQHRFFSWKSHISSCKQFIQHNNIIYKRSNSSSLFSPSLQDSPSTFPIPVDVHCTKLGYKLITCLENTTIRSPPHTPDLNQFDLFGQFSRDNEEDIIQAIQTNRAKMCCDGSVLNKYGSFAYGLAGPTGDALLFSQHAPVHGDLDQITSTRCELMGIIACMEYLNYLANKYTFQSKPFILLTADNQQAILSPKRNKKAIKNTFCADMDLILHVQYLIKHLPFRLKLQHIRGHQDKVQDYSSLSTLAKLNVQMDELAKKYFQEPINAPAYHVHSPTLPGEIISIFDAHSKIVKSFTFNLTRHSTGLLAEDQLAKSLKIPPYRLSLLHWDIFSRLHSRQPKHIKSFLTKSIHRHLPIMKRQKTWKLIDCDTCPLCETSQENENHLFQCPHAEIQTFRRQKLKDLQDELTSIGTDPFIQRHLLRLILQFTNRFPVTPIQECTGNPEAVLGINEQIKLGIGNLLRGILAWRLGDAQQIYYRSKNNFQSTGDSWTRKLTQFFFSCSHAIWTNRCDKIASTTEMSYEDSTRHQCSSLLFRLTRNPHQLPVNDRHLIHRKSSFTKTASIRALTSWASRVKLGLERARTGQKNSTSDIRNWFNTKAIIPPETTIDTTIDATFAPHAHDDIDTTEAILFSTSNSPLFPAQTQVRTLPGLPYIPYQQYHTNADSDSISTNTTLNLQHPSYRDI